MAQRVLHTVCSLWLAMLLVFGVAPKEIIHSFAHHKDTIHQRDVKGPVVENIHHHCSFLGFRLLPFAEPPHVPVILQELAAEYFAFRPFQDEKPVRQRVSLREGRGPPTS